MSMDFYFEKNNKNAPFVDDERFDQVFGYSYNPSFPYMTFHGLRTYNTLLEGLVPYRFEAFDGGESWSAEKIKEQYEALNKVVESGKIDCAQVEALRDLFAYAVSNGFSGYIA